MQNVDLMTEMQIPHASEQWIHASSYHYVKIYLQLYRHNSLLKDHKFPPFTFYFFILIKSYSYFTQKN